jgi:DNA-binding transcriptional ArsR family regulator
MSLRGARSSAKRIAKVSLASTAACALRRNIASSYAASAVSMLPGCAARNRASSAPSKVRPTTKEGGRRGGERASSTLDRSSLAHIVGWLYSSLAMNEAAHLDLVFSALADPTRRAILARLSTGEATVSELLAPLEIAQPTLSRHLKVLEEAGLIVQGRDAQRRPRSLVVGGPLREVDTWLGPFREQWERRFDRLEQVLVAKQRRRKQTQNAKQKEKQSP